MNRSICVIVNAGSGAGHDPSLVERLRALFERAGAHAEIALARGGAELATCIETAIAQHPAVIVAGGGDGTISSVGAALVDSAIALGVLPLGTLNHFARDAGVSLDLERAVDAIVNGRPTPVDVGEVNGRIFLNNSSLGLYPDIVRDRERQQKRLGRGKWPALA
ncbi:MAG: diacylglycerol kinase family protein, partial [Caldimonas sp.]